RNAWWTSSMTRSAGCGVGSARNTNRAMPELKQLAPEAIPAALEKAERYRLLNEPAEAESICLDVLAVDSENQQALVTLLLAMSDRFSKGYAVSDTQAKEVLVRIKGEYERA